MSMSLYVTLGMLVSQYFSVCMSEFVSMVYLYVLTNPYVRITVCWCLDVFCQCCFFHLSKLVSQFICISVCYSLFSLVYQYVRIPVGCYHSIMVS